MRLRSEFLSSATFREDDIPIPPVKWDVIVKDKTFKSKAHGIRYAEKQLKAKKKAARAV